ncbi:MAG TPA: hypothetical protein VN522_12435 [Solirubrobacterales bacterium]|nr:hypothetical protein [Solirubrobacterales bacterium]
MRALAGGVGIVLLVIVAGFVAQRIFGGSGDSTSEARDAVEATPDRITMREPYEHVLAGTARGEDGAVVHFAFAAEEPSEPDGIPPRLIHLDKNPMEDGEFWVWADSEPRLPGESLAEYIERADITTEIEEALCREATGEACR